MDIWFDENDVNVMQISTEHFGDFRPMCSTSLSTSIKTQTKGMSSNVMMFLAPPEFHKLQESKYVLCNFKDFSFSYHFKESFAICLLRMIML